MLEDMMESYLFDRSRRIVQGRNVSELIRRGVEDCVVISGKVHVMVSLQPPLATSKVKSHNRMLR
jgi:hypothetical protein